MGPHIEARIAVLRERLHRRRAARRRRELAAAMRRHPAGKLRIVRQPDRDDRS